MGDVAAFVVAWLVLAVASLLVGVMPFSWTRALLGAPTPGSLLEPTPGPAQHRRARRTAVALQRAVRRSPWRSDCYPQALAARVLLRAARVPHTVLFGLRRSDGQMLAHAWVRAGDLAVAGGDGADYTAVGTFSWSPGRAGTGR